MTDEMALLRGRRPCPWPRSAGIRRMHWPCAARRLGVPGMTITRPLVATVSVVVW